MTLRPLPRLDVFSHSSFASWTIVVWMPHDDHCIIDDCLAINLSQLDIITEDKLLSAPVNRIINQILEVVGSRPYLDDKGRMSWGRFTANEALVATLWVKLRSKILPEVRSFSIKRLPDADFAPGSLWVRIGSVEGAALFSWLRNPKNASEAAKTVADIVFSGAKLPQLKWWPRLDARENIFRLNTNAGWYSTPDYASESFEKWAHIYFQGVKSGNLFSGQMGGFLRAIPYLDGNLPVASIDQTSILSVMSEKRVLVVSPMADLVRSQFESRNVERLWAHWRIGPPNALEAIPAPVSVFPLMPDVSWLHSFDNLSQYIIQAIDEFAPEFFIASCGCYAIPLANFVHSNFKNITCVAPGHITHALFGVLTKAEVKTRFYTSTKYTNSWTVGNLSDYYPEVTELDRGRYGSP